jgi:hypothetical protein
LFLRGVIDGKRNAHGFLGSRRLAGAVHFSDAIENLIMNGFFALELISFDRLGTSRCQELDGFLVTAGGCQFENTVPITVNGVDIGPL